MPEHPHNPSHHHEAHIHQGGKDHRDEQDCPGDETELDEGKPELPMLNSGSGGHGGSQPPPPPKPRLPEDD